jgi:hypothetical protein
MPNGEQYIAAVLAALVHFWWLFAVVIAVKIFAALLESPSQKEKSGKRTQSRSETSTC